MRGFPTQHISSGTAPGHRLNSADQAKRLAEATNLSRRYVLLASTLALIPFPLIDFAAILSLQLKLVHDLAKIYNLPIQAHLARPLLSALLSGCAVTSGGVLLIAIGKTIPGLGTLVGGGLAGSLAGTTLATSEIFIRHFEAGGTLSDFVSPATHPSAKTVSADLIPVKPATDAKDHQANVEILVTEPSENRQTDEQPPVAAQIALDRNDDLGPALQQEPTLEMIYGIGPVYVARLKSSGIHDLQSLLTLGPDQMRQILGARVSHATANNFLAQARALIHANTS